MKHVTQLDTKTVTQYIPGHQDDSINIQTVHTDSKTTASTYRLYIQPSRRQHQHTDCTYSQQDGSINIQTVHKANTQVDFIITK